MTTAQQVLGLLQDNLDLYEQPPGSNHVPGVTDRPGFWDDAWCDMYLSMGFEESGLSIHFASCYYSRRAYEDGVIGEWLGKPPLEQLRPGDQGLYGQGGADHTGIVAAVDVWARRILCYEGNWGDRSLALWRDYDDQWIFGFGRPNYDDVPSYTPPATPDSQMAWNPHSDNPWTPLYVDGVCGPITWSAVQWSLNDSSVPDLYNVSPIDVDGERGPSTYSALQSYVGAGVDGVFGPQSTIALQRHLGVKPDGEWGPVTSKGLQAALNDKTF